MRAFQGTFARLKSSFISAEGAKQKILLTCVVLLFNLNFCLVGINQILNTSMRYLNVKANNFCVDLHKKIIYCLPLSAFPYPLHAFQITIPSSAASYFTQSSVLFHSLSFPSLLFLSELRLFFASQFFLPFYHPLVMFYISSSLLLRNRGFI